MSNGLSAVGVKPLFKDIEAISVEPPAWTPARTAIGDGRSDTGSRSSRP